MFAKMSKKVSELSTKVSESENATQIQKVSKKVAEFYRWFFLKVSSPKLSLWAIVIVIVIVIVGHWGYLWVQTL